MPVETRSLGDPQYRPGTAESLPILSNDDLMVGDVVYINGEGDWRGKVCYVGEVHFAKGDWAGVALDHPMGNHDGVAKGQRYFQCPPNHGIFTRVNRLSKKMLIPETLDAEKLGLTRPKFQREFSGSPEPILIKSRSTSRESSPFFTAQRNVSFNENRNTSSPPPPPPQISAFPVRSRSPTPGGKHVEGLKIGERVIVGSTVGDSKAGILRYLGPVDFETGTWAGIELFHPLGKNDGTVRGREYFRCQHPYGLFVPVHKVETSPANKTLGRKMGTRENLYAVMSATRGVRAGSYEEYY